MAIFARSRRTTRRLRSSGFALGAGTCMALLAQGAAADEWKLPRTAGGQPDLQGYWTNNTIVPLERPAAYADRAELTEEEARARLTERLAPEETEAGTDADVHYQLTDFALDHSQNGVVLDTRTSLIVDPTNGRIPAPLPGAADAARERAAYNRAHAFDAAENRSLAERCIIWSHQGPPIIPVGYNSNLEIFQTKEFVVIVTEMMPDPRIVPLDAREHLPNGMRQWLGASRGRWDGDTLVVETTNFTGKTQIRGMSAGLFLTENAKVTERFERTGPEEIRYGFTVEDTSLWARPWSAEYGLQKIEGPMFEYACHEGNYGLANTLSGARAAEREAAAGSTR